MTDRTVRRIRTALLGLSAVSACAIIAAIYAASADAPVLSWAGGGATIGLTYFVGFMHGRAE